MAFIESAFEKYALDFGVPPPVGVAVGGVLCASCFGACVAVRACWLFVGGGAAATDAYLPEGVEAELVAQSFAEMQMQMANMMARQAKVVVNLDLDKLLQEVGLKVNLMRMCCMVFCLLLTCAQAFFPVEVWPDTQAVRVLAAQIKTKQREGFPAPFINISLNKCVLCVLDWGCFVHSALIVSGSCLLCTQSMWLVKMTLQ